MRQLSLIFFLVLVVSCGRNTTEKETPVNDSPTLDAMEPVEPSDAVQDSPQTAEDAERTEWQNPDFILQLLGNLEGKIVADLGAGSGYFSFKIARQAGKVIALDIDPRALDYIKEQKQIVGSWSENIEARLTPADVPNLTNNEVDIVLIVNTYTFVPNKKSYLPRLLAGIRPGGKLVIVDFKTGAIPVGPSDDFKMDADTMVQELEAAGFRSVEKDEQSLQYQYIVTAVKE